MTETGINITGIVKEIKKMNLPKEEKQQLDIFHEITQARKAKGLTWSELAEKSGVEEKTIKHMEAMIAEPSLMEVLKLSSALNINLEIINETC